MKKILNSFYTKATSMFLCLMTGVYAYAQDTVEQSSTLTSADYHVQMPKTMDPVYNGPLRFIVMGLALVLILYVTYRYWDANRRGKDILHEQ